MSSSIKRNYDQKPPQDQATPVPTGLPTDEPPANSLSGSELPGRGPAPTTPPLLPPPNLKGLPLDTQSFAEIIDNDLLYADKTKYVYNLLNSGLRNIFLSRPRGFGKTLLLSTLEELFSEKRERFDGLWIAKSDYDFLKHPIIHLSLSMDTNSSAELKANLKAIDQKDYAYLVSPETTEVIKLGLAINSPKHIIKAALAPKA